MYPKVYSGTVWAEEQVFNALTLLDDDWHVFSDLFFPVPRKGQTTLDGQIDFLLVHHKYGVIVMEVKGGTIALEKGEWTSTNKRGTFPIKDPFKQASDYKYVVKRLLESGTGVEPWCMHAVSFPVGRAMQDGIGTNPGELILSEQDLADPNSAVMRVIGYFKPHTPQMNQTELDRVVKHLAPTLSLKPPLASEVKSELAEQLQLTTQQQQIFALTRYQSRCWINGGAGTGKTVLAVGRAEQLAIEEKRVLLLCYNAPLGESLRSRFADSDLVTAGHFHSVARKISVAKIPSGAGEEFWRVDLADAFLSACAERDLTWDAVLIDEGQDFSNYWFETLEQVIAPGPSSQFVVFADENQRIFDGRDPVQPTTEPLVLDVNCRNTPEISNIAFGSIGLDVQCLRTSSIPPTIDIEDDFMKSLRTRLHEIIVDGEIDVSRVAVLSSSRPLIDDLQGTRIGRWNATDLNGSGIRCETIQRFKGLEADAVVLVIPDDGPVDSSLLYVGASRARAVLAVIATTKSAAQLGL